MVYRFIKHLAADGSGGSDVKRIGAVDATELENVLQTYLTGGWELATAEEYDTQVLGALNSQLEAATARVAELESAVAPEAALADPTSEAPAAE